MLAILLALVLLAEHPMYPSNMLLSLSLHEESGIFLSVSYISEWQTFCQANLLFLANCCQFPCLLYIGFCLTLGSFASIDVALLHVLHFTHLVPLLLHILCFTLQVMLLLFCY